jgi:ABC-2 type transport system ATP-binding protein
MMITSVVTDGQRITPASRYTSVVRSSDASGRTDEALRVQHVSRHIDGRAVLAGVDLHAAKGTILGLVGPNGAGKTSLLRAISGRLRIDRGAITIEGLTPQLARRSGRLGVVPQEIALYPHLTVRENLGVLGRLAGVPRHNVLARVDEGLAWAGLADRADARVPALSGGMRRRVNLVASTLHHPGLLLLDEPTVGVDADARARLHDLLRALRARGVSVLIATHDLDEATHLCDEVAVMAGGTVLARDAVPALISRTVGSGREVTITLTGDPGPDASAVLDAEGFWPVGARQWTRSGSGTFADLAVLEQRLAAASINVVETRVNAPSLAGAIAALARTARTSAA